MSAGGSETEWNIDYGAPGYTPGTGTSITSNPYVLTSGGAGDVSSWVGQFHQL